MKSKKIHQNILKDKIIKVYVKQDEHANLDSLPLRFGYYYKENKVLEIYNCREQSIENDEDKTGTKYRITADFLKDNGEEASAQFIILKDQGKFPFLVTLWIKEFFSENLLSEKLKYLRKEGEIAPDDLIEIHPYYVNGEANTVEGLIRTLNNMRKKSSLEKDEEIGKREIAEKERDNAIDEKNSNEEDFRNVLKNIHKELNEIKSNQKVNSGISETPNEIINNPQEEPKSKFSYDDFLKKRDSYELKLQTSAHVTKIFGPPGTGKTTYLLNIMEKLLERGIHPSKIGFFSYTNKAVNEAKDRLILKNPKYKSKDFIGFKTLHSLANQSLRNKSELISFEQAKNFDEGFINTPEQVVEDDITSLQDRPKHTIIDIFVNARSRMIDFEEEITNLDPLSAVRVNKWLGYAFNDRERPVKKEDYVKLISFKNSFLKYKRELDVIDFTGILEKALYEETVLPKFDVVFLDEAQDTNKLQWVLAEKIFNNSKAVYITGDDDQAICETMGASNETFFKL